MTITLELPKTTESKVKKRAKSRGLDVNEYVISLVERDILPSWEELVKPIHDETKRLGLTEKDIEELVDSELAAYRRENPLRCR
jgi:phosphotransacetylase